jgi:hypothetical protein
MPVAAIRFTELDTFRSEWVCGHLDHQRASDALKAARESCARLRAAADAAADEAARCAEEAVELAVRRLLEVEARLAAQFDRFCDVGQ